MGLILSCDNTICCSNTAVIILLWLAKWRHNTWVRLCINWMLTSIRLSQFCHEVTLKHSLPHLFRVVLLLQLNSKWSYSSLVKSTNSFVRILCIGIWLTSNIRKHIMNPRIVCRLEHNALLGWIHFINTQGSLLVMTLTFYPISHEKCLIRFSS